MFAVLPRFADRCLCACADNTAPTSALGVALKSGTVSPTNAATVSFSLSFDESVTGIAAGKFTLSGSCTGTSLSGFAGSGAGP